MGLEHARDCFPVFTFILSNLQEVGNKNGGGGDVPGCARGTRDIQAKLLRGAAPFAIRGVERVRLVTIDDSGSWKGRGIVLSLEKNAGVVPDITLE